MPSIHWPSVDHSLDECIKCNICTSYCPVAAVTDKFAGPKYSGPQAERFRTRLTGQAGEQGGTGAPAPTPDHSVDYCSGCRICNDVCPTGVRIAELNARARARMAVEQGIPLRNRLLGRNELLGQLGSMAPGMANFALHNPLSRLLADKVVRIARKAPLPRWSTSGSLRQWVSRTSARRLRAARKVVYFHGCATQYYEPYVGKATIAVLEHNGFEVIVPPQNCCGLPMLSNGEFGAAAGYHRNNVARLAGFARAGFPIVGSSTSCTLTLKEEAPELLDMHDEASSTLARAVWDVFEFLRDLHEKGELRTDFRRLEMVLPYHAPCQLRAHRVGKPALDVLALVSGLEVRESEARCCGIAGTYGYKSEKYQIAMDVGEELFRFLRAQGPTRFSACDSETCRWQMEHGSGIPSRHPIEVLAAAYGLYDLDSRTLT